MIPTNENDVWLAGSSKHSVMVRRTQALSLDNAKSKQRKLKLNILSGLKLLDLFGSKKCQAATGKRQISKPTYAQTSS